MRKKMSRVVGLFLTISFIFHTLTVESRADNLQKSAGVVSASPLLSADANTLKNVISLREVFYDPAVAETPMRIAAPVSMATAAASASAEFIVEYQSAGETNIWGGECTDFPEEAKTAINAAADIWANIISSTVPITIQACWAIYEDGSLVLGSSGVATLHRNFSSTDYVRPDTWYMPALANALHGADLDLDEFDMYINYNESWNWYFGVDGEAPARTMDLLSVVLHEIAHGLNFAGSMSYSSETGEASLGYGTSLPNIYDVFIRDGAGTQLIDEGSYSRPSEGLADALKSDDIWFHGMQAVAENGRQPVKIYAPSSWRSGSSYSHLDYLTFNETLNELMVYAMGSGESIHDPGDVTRGLLFDLGWHRNPLQQPDLVIDSASVPVSVISANQSFTLTAAVKNLGLAASPEATLHYLLSDNSIISVDDTELAVKEVRTLGSRELSYESHLVIAPDTDGRYWVGACIDAVEDERNPLNQCSDAVEIRVATEDRPDLVTSAIVNDYRAVPGQVVTVLATVMNSGLGGSEDSVLRYYRSADYSSLFDAGNVFDTDTVSPISPGGILRGTASFTTPVDPQSTSYWFGVCVDPVVNESNTGNQCSGEQGLVVADYNGLPMVITQEPTAVVIPTATGNGTIDSLGDSSPTAHGICWSVTTVPTVENSDCTDEGAVSEAGSFTSQMTGLVSDTKYYYRAYATNSYGTAYGHQGSFNPSHPSVTTEETTSIGFESVVGNGTVINLGETSPTEHGVCWRAANTSGIAEICTSEGPVSSPGSFTSRVAGLLPDTRYLIRAYAANIYATAYGSYYSFTTTTPQAPSVTTLNVTSVEGTRAEGHGTLTSFGDYPVTDHGICWSTTRYPTAENGLCSGLGVKTMIGPFSNTMRRLYKNTRYYVRAYAVNEAGTVYGDQVVFTTGEFDVFPWNLYLPGILGGKRR